ncbi:MAG: F0F1 ATP synthase subunit B [Erysipelotrichia bacterium]|jgi:F-type H+-transporting ATPase subunit b|nr:F0F1 ATP synthase subunit B [Erysipelotrichia bacterium]
MINIDIMGKLFPDLRTMLVQLAATGVLFYLFRKYLWDTVSNYLNQRAEFLQQQLLDAKQANEEAQTTLDESKEQLQRAASEASRIIERGSNEGKRIKEELVNVAKQEAAFKLESARQQIEAERASMMSDVQKEIVDVAILASEKLLKNVVDAKADEALLEAYVKDVLKS